MIKISKKITNTTSNDLFISDVLLYETNNLDEFNIDVNNASLFRSGRQKNDLPSVCKFGKYDDALKDALTKISENGMNSVINKGNVIISDSLTIIGNDHNALFITFMGGYHHLIKTYIHIDNKGFFKKLEIIAEINKFLKPNEEFITEDVLLYTTNNVNKSIKEFALTKINNNKVKQNKPLSVYCTWYYYGSKIDLKNCTTNLDKIKELNLPIDVFQIDDGWEDKIGSWNVNDKFNLSRHDLAELIKSYNLIAGIWTSPFICEKDSSISINHPNWILKDTSNKPCLFNVNNKDYYIIDISIKETWDYFEQMYHDLTINDGFYYHKLDFTRAFLVAKDAKYFDSYHTPVESYISCISLIRKGMTDKAFFLMCGGLYDSLIGLVDAQRTGSDVLSMWTSSFIGGGKTIPYTIKQNLLRYYMSYWWYNDPDSLVLRRNKIKDFDTNLSLGLLNDEEVKSCVLNQLLGCGIVSFTENLNKVDIDRLNNLFKLLPISTYEIEISNLLDIDRYPNYIRLFNRLDNTSIYYVIFNMNDKDENYNISISDILGEYKLDNDSLKYTVIDHYGKSITDNNTLDSLINTYIFAHSANIICVTTNKIKDYDFNGHYIIKKDVVC